MNAHDDGRPSPERRVRAALAKHGIEAALIEPASRTATAESAAEAIGCHLGQIAKSLVFMADGTPVLAVVAGDRRGDADVIAGAVGATRARLADPATVEAVTGYTVGSVSPFDLPADLPVLVDASLERFERVYPAGGSDRSMVDMTFGQLIAITGGRVSPIGR